jgi:zinc D-Ala-D-Ala carboxypeptidase
MKLFKIFILLFCIAGLSTIVFAVLHLSGISAYDSTSDLVRPVQTQLPSPSPIVSVTTTYIATPIPTPLQPTPSPTLAPKPTQDPSLYIVNKKVSLGRYQPEDLVNFQNIKVSARITTDLTNMIAAAYADGIELRAVSGYRSYEDQIKTFNDWVAEELKTNPSLTREQAEVRANYYSAKPGHSEHQLGTVVDVLSSETNYQFDSNRALKYVQWIEKNAYKYNFKISFVQGNPEYKYEPWHLRWYPKS